jgi:hypothetical protein
MADESLNLFVNILSLTSLISPRMPKSECYLVVQYKGQHFICPDCYVTISRRVWNNCTGVDRRGLSCGENSGE